MPTNLWRPCYKEHLSTASGDEHEIFGTSPEVEPKTDALWPKPYALPYQSQPYEPVALSSFIKTSFGYWENSMESLPPACKQAVEGKRLLQAQPNLRHMAAGNLHTSMQALSDSDRACISQCRTAHRICLTVFAFTPGIPAQHTWHTVRALHVRMKQTSL
jgi:hypothetical protein